MRCEWKECGKRIEAKEVRFEHICRACSEGFCSVECVRKHQEYYASLDYDGTLPACVAEREEGDGTLSPIAYALPWLWLLPIGGVKLLWNRIRGIFY